MRCNIPQNSVESRKDLEEGTGHLYEIKKKLGEEVMHLLIEWMAIQPEDWAAAAVHLLLLWSESLQYCAAILLKGQEMTHASLFWAFREYISLMRLYLSSEHSLQGNHVVFSFSSL